MMRFIKLFLFTISYITSSDAQQTTFVQLTIKISGINNISGDMYTCLVDDEKSYLGNCGNGQKTKVDSSSLTLTFENIPIGEYCVTLFHDIDGDGKMKRKLFGLPAEPYGFSNNPSTVLGPPKYKKCKFELASDKSIHIKI